MYCIFGIVCILYQQMVRNFLMLHRPLLRGEWYFANHLHINQSECLKSTINIFTCVVKLLKTIIFHLSVGGQYNDGYLPRCFTAQ